MLELKIENKKKNTALLKKATAKEARKTKKASGLLDVINRIQGELDDLHHDYTEEYSIITSVAELQRQISNINQSKSVILDIIATSTNPCTAELIGLSMYYDNNAIYVPIGHIDYYTNEKTERLTDLQLIECFSQLNTAVIMFDATHKIRILRKVLHVDVQCCWDVAIAAKCLNENEEDFSLDRLCQKYCKNMSTIEQIDALAFSRLSHPYAAKYAVHTLEQINALYYFQARHLARKDLSDVRDVFLNIEMPLIQVICDMEDAGMTFDVDYATELSKEYALREKQAYDLCMHEVEKAQHKIDKFLLDNPSSRFSLPLNLNSQEQVSIFLHDILHVTDQKSVSQEALGTIDHIFARTFLEYSHCFKMRTTFINKLIQEVQSDGKIHCKYHQYGAKTGRISSSDPNVQNIPSGRMRQMFIGGCTSRDVLRTNEGFVFNKTEEVQLNDGSWTFVEQVTVGDFLRDAMPFKVTKIKIDESQLGTVLIDIDSKDQNVVIRAKERSVLLSSDYSQQEPRLLAALCGDENMISAYKDGKDLYALIASLAFNTEYADCLETSKEGKFRRNQAKKILLGMIYGRGDASLADQLDCSINEARRLTRAVYRHFPRLLDFEKSSIQMSEDNGFVTTLYGRKRRRVNMRQAINARVQGSAADMIKLAMIKVHNNEYLQQLRAKLLITLHDELILQVPARYAKLAATYVQHEMEHVLDDITDIPIKCDIYISSKWK